MAIKQEKKTVLIADDSEMNRDILADILGEAYEIVEAEDGVQAIEAMTAPGAQIDMLLLDYVMPRMDGFKVLEEMNRLHLIEHIPVVMISAENSTAYMERAYDLGVVDFIKRPFETLVVQRRVANTMVLYAKQKRLRDMVLEQIYEKERQNSLMIDILSHIVEFHNGESGLHVRNIHILTKLLLKHLARVTDKYPMTGEEVAQIITASALHDIGKIDIPDKILNKPGRLTEEEFAVMKTHTTIGSDMLKKMPAFESEPMIKMAYGICRWHHERYDGRGYPDGLKGDEIPIGAQVVALADVYDALTSIRVYKSSYSHETAIEMILDGKCGTFNPLLLDCLRGSADDLKKKLEGNVAEDMDRQEIRSVTEAVLSGKAGSVSERTLNLLDYERRQTEIEAESAKNQDE